MRRRPRDASEAPPAELVRFPGDAYFHDPALWEARFEEWCDARRAWADTHGLEEHEAFPVVVDEIPDAPFDPRSL